MLILLISTSYILSRNDRKFTKSYFSQVQSSILFTNQFDIIYVFGLDESFYKFDFQASRNSEPIRVKWFNGSDVDKFAQYQISNGDKRAYRASG